MCSRECRRSTIAKLRWRGEILDEAERDPAFAREEVKGLLNYVSAAKLLAVVRKVIEADLAS